MRFNLEYHIGQYVNINGYTMKVTGMELRLPEIIYFCSTEYMVSGQAECQESLRQAIIHTNAKLM